MIGFNIMKFDQIRNKFAGTIKEAASMITGNDQLELKGETHFSKAKFKSYMSLNDDIADIKKLNVEKINDRIDRYKKQINLAYWANVNNIEDNSQIVLHAQEALPEIYTIKKIHITIVIGRIVMQIGDQEERVYSPCDVIDVPIRTMMKIKNRSSYKSATIIMKS
ncbi:MAG: hypothetical protein SCM11_02235 [Bacillota bacterium]|nr:hypothetical protein [Bacillota bacterium]